MTTGLDRGPGALDPRLHLHDLRRTFTSILFAIGETPPYVMALGGTHPPNLTLAIYAREMSRRDGEPECLKALVEGRECSGAPQPAPGTSPAAGEQSR